MAKRIFVTATNTDIGKTYTTQKLLREYASRGLRVGVLKPIETGVVAFAPDGDLLLELVKSLNSEFKNITQEMVVPVRYELPAAPFVASGNRAFDFKLLDTSLEQLEKLCDVIIIEGAGGLYVPVDEKTMMIDIIKYLQAATLLVTHCSLGCINDTLLSSRALNAEGINHIIAFNCRENDKSFSLVSEPYFLQIQQEVLKVEQSIDTICDVLYNL
jgi:dethiobiotin synthetase